jgi:hypothetical protein
MSCMQRWRGGSTALPPPGDHCSELENYCAELERYCDQLETIIDYHVKRLEDTAVTLWDSLYWSSCAEQMNVFARDLRAEVLDRHRPERPPHYRPRE